MTPRFMVAAVIVLGACTPMAWITAAAQLREEPTRAFAPIAAVLSSPRCANCHIPGEAPLQGDEGRPHAMRVQREADGRGTPAMRCTNCHQETNAPLRHAPPGAPDWRLPPAAAPMAWTGLTAREQCQMLKDPMKNGNKTLAELLEHVGHDRLVLAGWNPGPGRTLPPLSHDEFVTHFKTWIDSGAVCPD